MDYRKWFTADFHPWQWPFGTMLIRFMLNAHPDIYISEEVCYHFWMQNFKGRFRKRLCHFFHTFFYTCPFFPDAAAQLQSGGLAPTPDWSPVLPEPPAVRVSQSWVDDSRGR